jgi:hypothetical protein
MHTLDTVCEEKYGDVSETDQVVDYCLDSTRLDEAQHFLP